MKFIDFKLVDLIGKSVVWTCSDARGHNVAKNITTISSANKQGFVIDNEPLRLFSFFNGKQIFTKKHKDNAAISVCELIDPSRIQQIQNNWKDVTHKDELIAIIKDNISRLRNVPVDKLKQVVQSLAGLYDLSVPLSQSVNVSELKDNEDRDQLKSQIIAHLSQIKKSYDKLQSDCVIDLANIKQQINQLEDKLNG